MSESYASTADILSDTAMNGDLCTGSSVTAQLLSCLSEIMMHSTMALHKLVGRAVCFVQYLMLDTAVVVHQPVTACSMSDNLASAIWVHW